MKNLFHHIPPTGNRIKLKKSASEWKLARNIDYLVQSGTAALAASLDIVKKSQNSSRAEVILPAYCCPDLISAVLYNEMIPVLVDLEANTPYMDLKLLADVLNKNTAAIIAVNFLGIPERLPQIRNLLKDSDVILVEDSAQWFPESEKSFSEHHGDLVIYSFGKGKPVCLMGGGLLSIQKKELTNVQPRICESSKESEAKLIAKFLTYNIVITPRFYWALELLTFLNIGATEYHQLNNIKYLAKTFLPFIKPNVDKYQQRKPIIQTAWKNHLSKFNGRILELPTSSATYSNQRLLRYPILLPNRATRDKLINFSKEMGLGISALYEVPLPEIKGIPESLFNKKYYTTSKHFSERLATLPTHELVQDRHIEDTISILDALV